MMTVSFLSWMETFRRSAVRFLASTATSTTDCVWKNWWRYLGSSGAGASGSCRAIQGRVRRCKAPEIGPLFGCFVADWMMRKRGSQLQE